MSEPSLTQQLPVVLQLFGLSVDRGLGHHQPLLQLSVLLVAQGQVGAQPRRLLAELLLCILPELCSTGSFRLLQQH